MRVVLTKMFRGFYGMLVKIGHIYVGDLRLNLNRRHQQNPWAGRGIGPGKCTDGANQRHGAAGNIGGCHAEDRLAVVSAQHDHDRVQRLMSFEQHRQRANAVEIGVQMAHIVAHRRAAV